MKITMTMSNTETKSTLKMAEKICAAIDSEFNPSDYLVNEAKTVPAGTYIQKVNDDKSVEITVDLKEDFVVDFNDAATDIALKAIGTVTQIAVFLKSIGADITGFTKTINKRMSKWMVGENDPASSAYKIVYRAAKDFRYMECGRGTDGYIAVVSDKENPECYLVVTGKNYQSLEKEVVIAINALFGEDSTRSIIHYFAYAAGSNRVKNISIKEIKGYTESK